MYTKIYLDHFSNPRNVGNLENPDAKAEVVNTEGGCFDTASLFVSMNDDKIGEAKYLLKACSGTIMAFSLLSTRMQGKTLPEVKEISFESLLSDLGELPEKKHHSLRLAIEAKNKIVEILENKQEC